MNVSLSGTLHTHESIYVYNVYVCRPIYRLIVVLQVSLYHRQRGTVDQVDNGHRYIWLVKPQYSVAHQLLVNACNISSRISRSGSNCTNLSKLCRLKKFVCG